MPNTPTRFPKGATDVSAIHPMNRLGIPYGPKWHVFFDDFDRYVVADYTLTTTEAGVGSATEALTDGPGGQLLITNDNADNDADFFQKVGESFKFVPGEQLFFDARFKVSDGTQSDVIIGLIITDTTPLANSDGVYFYKADDAANISAFVNKNAVATTFANIGTLANNTFTRWSFWYNGVDQILFFIDNVQVATYTVTTTLPDDEDLTVTFGIQNGEAVAKTMTMDYIFVAQERFPND